MNSTSSFILHPSSFVYPLIYTLSLAHMGLSWRQHNTRAMSNTEQAAVQSGRQGDFLPPSRNQAGRAARLVLYFLVSRFIRFLSRHSINGTYALPRSGHALASFGCSFFACRAKNEPQNGYECIYRGMIRNDS